MMDSIKEDYSDVKIVKCTNTEAIKAKSCSDKTPTVKCEFCGKELEQIGMYMSAGIFFRKWTTYGEYERCNCSKAKKLWEEIDLKEKKEKEEKEKKENEIEAKTKLEKMMRYSNLGGRFLERTFDNFKITEENNFAYTRCKKYADKFSELKFKGVGIALNGNYGSGKTHLAAAIAHEIIKQGHQPIFGNLISLLGKIKSSYGDIYSKENEETIINRYINCDLLIIDDLGKEKPTQWVIEKLYHIINCRYENNKPIVITSNYTNERLLDRLSVDGNLETAEAIVSRLYEICQGVDMFRCNDYRRN